MLGSGNLALILDPTAMATRAGIALEEAESDVVIDAEATSVIDKTDYLLVDISGRRAAVSLNDVLRIEQLPVSRIEYIGSRPVLNFQGQILPVEDSAGLLSMAEPGSEAQIVVVVCRDGDRHVGFVVSHVLDVTAGADLFEAGSGRRTEKVTLLKDRVTGLLDLGDVPALPVSATAAHSSRFAEVSS